LEKKKTAKYAEYAVVFGKDYAGVGGRVVGWLSRGVHGFVTFRNLFVTCTFELGRVGWSRDDSGCRTGRK
jgi:hypothetical protein